LLFCADVFDFSNDVIDRLRWFFFSFYYKRAERKEEPKKEKRPLFSLHEDGAVLAIIPLLWVSASPAPTVLPLRYFLPIAWLGLCFLLPAILMDKWSYYISLFRYSLKNH
jgi:hypothetical protein